MSFWDTLFGYVLFAVGGIRNKLFGQKSPEKKLQKHAAVKDMIDVLSSEQSDWWSRRDAANMLGETRDISAVDPLIRALSYTKDWRALSEVEGWVRVAAAKALGKIGDVRSGDPLLIAAANDENAEVRRASGEAATAMGIAPPLDPFLNALGFAARTANRIEATRYLGAFGNDEQIEPLIAVLQDREEELRNAALDALLSMGWKADESVRNFFGSDPQRWFNDPYARARPQAVYNPSLFSRDEYEKHPMWSVKEWPHRIAEEPWKGQQYTRATAEYGWDELIHALFDVLKQKFQLDSARAVSLLIRICPHVANIVVVGSTEIQCRWL